MGATDVAFNITYTLPTPETPFTTAMATDRLAGGRGIEFATHTITSTLPIIQRSLRVIA